MSGFLARACSEARERVAAAAARVPLAAMEERAHAASAPPAFADGLAHAGVAIIAEIKRASPSRGRIASIPDAAALAAEYAHGGAAAVSVLTESAHFDGSLEDLAMVARRVPLPVLRKDFIVDAYQLAEARVHGAAAALLIVAALAEDELVELVRAADGFGLDVLVETHDGEEVAAAARAWAAAGTSRRLVVGVNARNLSTLEVDPRRFAELRPLLPADAVAVAESGVRGPDDVALLVAAGADAVLVGEHVARAPDPAGAVAALVASGAPAGTTVEITP